MKYAICNEIFGDLPFSEAWTLARKLGYTGVEIAPFTLNSKTEFFDVRDIHVDRRTEAKKQAHDAGLDVVGLHWLLAKTNGLYLTSPDVSVRNKTSEYLKALAQFCADLDGKILVLGSKQHRDLLPGVSYAEAEQYAAEVLIEVMPTYANLDLTLAIEPLGSTDEGFLSTAEQGIRLAELVNSPHCKLHLDVKAMSFEEKSIPDVISDSRDWLVHFHANDPNLLGPGMGDLDYEPIFSALNEIEYDGWVSVEVFSYEPGPEVIAGRSIEYMQKVAQQ